jgi:hypothetical protein
MNQIFDKIEASFKASMKGEETLHNLIWWWGAIGYLTAFFVIDEIVKVSTFRSVDILVSILTSVYFAWHIFVLKKCAPKKPQLSKEEKQALRQERRKNFGKKFLRKLLLQESFSEWDPVFISIVIDLFSIATFSSYILR